MTEPDPATPPPLVVAAGLAGIEGVVMVGYAVSELFRLTSGRVGLGLAVAGFFALYGVFLGVCGWGLLHGRVWARGPVVLTQLLMLGLAWGVRDTLGLAIPVAVVAAVALAGTWHPASVDHLNRADL